MTTQGTEARRGETVGLDAKRDGPVGVADAPQTTDNRENIVTTSEQQAVPVAQEAPIGMKPWLGSDTAPEDYTGGNVLLRNGRTFCWMPLDDLRWQHAAGDGKGEDVIAYTARYQSVPDATQTREAEATQTFELVWIAAARPPVHPEPMKGRQRFNSFERAMRFMGNQPDDAQFVSLHADLNRRYDRSEDARAALNARDAA